MGDVTQTVLLVANGPLSADAAARLSHALTQPHVLIGVDGGCRHLLRLERTPTLVTGDFDSLTPTELALLEKRGAQIVPTPDQEYTDLDKALTLARTTWSGAPIRIFGATGGRLDHLYSVLSALIKHGRDTDIRLVDELGETFLITGSVTLRGDDLPGRTLSLMAFGPVEGIVARGVRWPLDGERLAPGERDGTLNEIVDPEVTLAARSGDLLALLHHPPSEFVVRQAASDTDRAGLVDLRWHVLRPGWPRQAAHFPHDDAPGTIHLVAVTQEGRVIGGATLLPQDGLQLRGMAVDPAWQGKGVGAAVLDAAHELARQRGTTLWCNARLSAEGFYARCGWKAEGPIFEVPQIGPHVVMRWCAS